MQTHELLPLIYDNFDVFHTMCLSTSLLATYNSDEFDADAHKIISFIGKSFKLKQNLVDEFEACILGDMMNIGLVSDYQAISSTELLTDKDKENIELYEIKGRILEEVALSEIQNCNAADFRVLNQVRSNMKYEYFHHPYNAKLRFWQLCSLSRSGSIPVVREIAVLYSLGIGCQLNLKKAKENFLKCLLWGDKISAVLVGELTQEPEFKKIYFDDDPVLEPQCKASQYLEIMQLLETYILSFKKDFLINNELAKVLISEEIDQSEKIDLILYFDSRTWRSINTLTKSKRNTIGF